MFRELTSLKTVSGLAFILNLLDLFGLGEYPEQIIAATELVDSLAVIDIGNLSHTMLNLFTYSMYGLLFVYLATYVLIFFGNRMGRWLLVFSLLSIVPVYLTLGGIVYTMAELLLSTVICMLDGCLIYLLFFSKKTERPDVKEN